MEPYNRFLSSHTKIGGYKKSEDGEFLATGGLSENWTCHNYVFL